MGMLTTKHKVVRSCISEPKSGRLLHACTKRGKQKRSAETSGCQSLHAHLNLHPCIQLSAHPSPLVLMCLLTQSLMHQIISHACTHVSLTLGPTEPGCSPPKHTL